MWSIHEQLHAGLATVWAVIDVVDTRAAPCRVDYSMSSDRCDRYRSSSLQWDMQGERVIDVIDTGAAPCSETCRVKEWSMWSIQEQLPAVRHAGWRSESVAAGEAVDKTCSYVKLVQLCLCPLLHEQMWWKEEPYLNMIKLNTRGTWGEINRIILQNTAVAQSWAYCLLHKVD